MKLEYHSAMSPHYQHLNQYVTHNTRKEKNKDKTHKTVPTLPPYHPHPYQNTFKPSHPHTIGGRGLSSAAEVTEASLRSTVLSFSLSLHR